MMVFGIILLIIGVLQVVMPKRVYMFGRRWMFKDVAEPNVGALFFTRMCGIFIIMLSLYAVIRSL